MTKKKKKILKFYYPSVDQIYIETDSKLKNIDGWEDWKIKWNEIYLNLIKENDPLEWSKEFFMIMIFNNHIENFTELVIDPIPEEPSQPEDKDVTSNIIKLFKTDFDNYLINLKEWHKKLINLAPKALEELSNFGEVKIEINPSVEYSGEDPRRFKNIVFSHEREEEWDLAIENLKKYYQAVNDYPEDYPYDECDIWDLTRFPIYLYKGGYVKEAWEAFDNLINGKYPVKKTKLNDLESHILKTSDLSIIYGKMRNICITEKRYKEALIYRCFDLYFGVCCKYFLSKVTDPTEFIYFITEDWQSGKKDYRRTIRSLRSSLGKDIKTRARMAKIEDPSVIAEIIVDAVKILPDYAAGEKMILKNIKINTNNQIFIGCEEGKYVLKKNVLKKKFSDSNWEWDD